MVSFSVPSMDDLLFWLFIVSALLGSLAVVGMGVMGAIP